MDNQANILWIERERVNISELLDYFDSQKDQNQAFTYTHAFSTKDAQEKIQKMTGLKLLITNLYADKYQGQGVDGFIRNNQESELLHEVPTLIYTLYVKNKSLSSTAQPCLCSRKRLERLEYIQKLNNVHFLSFHDASDKTFYKAIEKLQR